MTNEARAREIAYKALSGSLSEGKLSEAIMFALSEAEGRGYEKGREYEAKQLERRSWVTGFDDGWNEAIEECLILCGGLKIAEAIGKLRK